VVLSLTCAVAVSELELKRLYRRFKKLDKDGSVVYDALLPLTETTQGTLTTDEFLSIPEFASNPLLERVIAIFDTNKVRSSETLLLAPLAEAISRQDEEIEFKEFISALSIFSSKDNKEAKLKCMLSVCIMVLLGLSPAVAFRIYDIDDDGCKLQTPFCSIPCAFAFALLLFSVGVACLNC
jgi:Ca2+-binding EF-hand superfamily protein